MSAATLSLRLTPSTKGKCATGLICCIVIAMRHPFCKLDERLHHSGYPRDDIGLKPACAKNPRTRPLPLEPGGVCVWRALCCPRLMGSVRHRTAAAREDAADRLRGSTRPSLVGHDRPPAGSSWVQVGLS